MSEVAGQSVDLSEFELFQSIDNWRIDPVIDQKLATLKQYNALLQTSPLTHVELHEWVSAFDSELESLVGSYCSFTGLAQFPFVRDGEVTYPTGDYDEEMMYFKGVVPVVIDRPPESAEDRVLYQLHLMLTRQEITPEGKLAIVDGYCEVDQVVRLEFVSAMSIERAVQILQSEAPELLTEIDCAIYNPEHDADPSQRILNLKDLSYSLKGDEDDDTVSLIRRALSAYTNEMLAPDDEVPYIIKIDGDAWFNDDTGSSLPSLITARAIADMSGLVWAQHPDDETSMVPQLLVELHRSSPEKARESLCVPVSSIEQLESIRHNFYAAS